MKKMFLVLSFGFFVSGVISEVGFWSFWLMLPGLGPNRKILPPSGLGRGPDEVGQSNLKVLLL